MSGVESQTDNHMNTYNHLPLMLIVFALLAACATEPGKAEEVSYENGELYFSLPQESLQRISTRDQDVYLQQVVTGLSVLWGMVFLPDGRVLINERSGEIRVVEEGRLLDEPLQGLPEIHATGQGGLLDIALHPDYEDNGYIYITYNTFHENGDFNTALARFRLENMTISGFEQLFHGSEGFRSGLHFGSRIVFDDDGFVYFSIGDRGIMNSAQDLSTHTGAVFRLHDDGRIPADNPYVNDPDAQPEIWAHGLRNIQGMKRHPHSGRLWAHEHGPRGGDEINIIEPGLNYGWPLITHGINYNGTIITPDTARAGLEQPHLHWTPSIAPSGLTFVTSERYPGWKDNTMLVGTLAPRYLHRVVLDGEQIIDQEEMFKDIGRVRDVRSGPDGYVYIAVENPGIIYRLVPAL